MERFRVDLNDRDLRALRSRLAATRWTGDFGGDSWEAGTNGAYLRQLVEFWLNDYDWRATEREMNEYVHSRVTLQSTPIHFIQQRGRGPSPIPLVLTHGWPWTFWDYRKVIGPLADPAAHGGDPKDAFDVIVPSLPGYGYSMPLGRGFAFWEVADLWCDLMDVLGYRRFAAAGGDWGALIAAQLGHKHASRMIGVHLSLQLPLDTFSGGQVPPELFAEDELHLLRRNLAWRSGEAGYALLHRTKPRTASFSANDSPAGLLAWIVEKRRTWSGCGGELERCFSKTDLIDTAMIYWITESFGTAARLYYESATRPWTPSHARTPVVEAPTGLAILPDEVLHQPRRWAENYYNLKQRTRMTAGGHFAPMEQPDALVDDIRDFFRALR